MNRIILRKNRDSSVYRFHPWIFSGSIQSIVGSPKNGEVILVEDYQGKSLALGHYFEGSIAVRILSLDTTRTIEEILEEKIMRAYSLRKMLDLTHNPMTNMYRLIHGEGDGLSGLVVDIYGHTAVIQCHTVGMYYHLNTITDILVRILGNDIHIYDKSADLIREANPKGYIRGQYYEEKWVENGFQFDIDWERGQKTGFFLDQRNNRNLLRKYVQDKYVANLFSYSGGFSIYAYGAGAKRVISVDASQSANDICQKNFQLNFGMTHETITADAVEYVKTMSGEFDVIILDPPAFAKHLSAKHKAIQAYKRLNAHVMRHIKRGGVLFTFSCSQVIDRQTFQDTITAAGIEAGRDIKILHHLSQPEDHPVNLFHPESNYLKGLVLYID